MSYVFADFDWLSNQLPKISAYGDNSFVVGQIQSSKIAEPGNGSRIGFNNQFIRGVSIADGDTAKVACYIDISIGYIGVYNDASSVLINLDVRHWSINEDILPVVDNVPLLVPVVNTNIFGVDVDTASLVEDNESVKFVVVEIPQVWL